MCLTYSHTGRLSGLLVLVISLVLVLVRAGRGQVIEHCDPDYKPLFVRPIVRPPAEPAASRSLGGNNITWHSIDFPWVTYFYRNPYYKFAVPYDGYLTGFGLELGRDLLLINKAVVARATVKICTSNTTSVSLMAVRKIRFASLIDPTKNLWPDNDGARMAVLEHVANVSGNSWALYRVTNVSADGMKHWSPPGDTWKYCKGGDWWNRHQCDEWQWRRYPDLDVAQYQNFLTGTWYNETRKDYAARDYCYAYSISAPNWKEANNYATKYGLPAYPDYLVKADSDYLEREQRYWSRWPVKRNSCWDKDGGTVCEFEFDTSRWEEDHRKGKYSTYRASTCGTFQDVGAPIMCGHRMSLANILAHGYQGTFFEREKSRLSYVIEAPDDVDPKRPKVNDTGCSNTIKARMLITHYDHLKQLISY